MLATNTISINWEDLGLAARITAMDSVRADLVTQTLDAIGQDILFWASKGHTEHGNRLFYHQVWVVQEYNNGPFGQSKDVEHMRSADGKLIDAKISDIELEFIFAALQAGGIKVRKETYPGTYYYLSW